MPPRANSSKQPPRRSERRSSAILVLLNPDERAILDAGAMRDGLGLGPWLRMLGLRAANAPKPK